MTCYFCDQPIARSFDCVEEVPAHETCLNEYLTNMLGLADQLIPTLGQKGGVENAEDDTRRVASLE